MAEEPSFQDLMTRLRTGDDEAAQEVFFRFRCRLIALARRRLDSQIQQKVDAEDIIQSVLRSFFLRAGQGQYALENWDGLWSLLVVITLSKCARKREHFHAGKRDVQRERTGFPGEGPTQAFGREPTPEEAAVLAETIEEILRGLVLHEREMIVLFLQGNTVPEISKQVGWAERTVHRVLARVRRRVQRLHEAEAAVDRDSAGED